MLSLLAAFFIHWFADFALQDDNTAINKSKDNTILFTHCLSYGFWMGLIGLIVFFSIEAGLVFFIVCFITHFMIDYVTSRANAKLWMNNQRHHFFVMVGFDQFLHTMVIVWLFWFMGVYLGY